ncbi:hypothetical protein GPJ56_008173 [Histomonas meleagridis]|uniref:uncharacterized protein n=1 Tax=Histomonas meleagridis TaxID=135588 RepID=UPI00355AA3D6|nr:hypothetical protein GPJ56_008173 [Histomonas meleagridis]KAH0797194.1 hypothetical protein GO595_009876 [Histomonas meleagridis]
MSRRENNISQIVFDIHGGEEKLTTMNLATIPNKKRLVRNPNESFSLRTDDIDGSHYVPKTIHQRDSFNVNDIEGTKSKPMYDSSKPPVDLMKLDDIDGSHPRIIRQLPRSHRMVNPVDPQYDLPKYKVPDEPPPKFIRDTMKNDDVEGAHPMSYKTDKPPRDLMKLDDIEGATPKRRISINQNSHNPFDVKDINNDGIFKTRRRVDPLNPVYHFDGKDLTADDFGRAFPKHELKVPNFMETSDIDGAQADSATKKFRNFTQPPKPPDDDDYFQPASILMVPSMIKQEKEIEQQNIARTIRGKKIRMYEDRYLHAERGTGDPLQGFLRKKREASPKRKQSTF